MSRVIITGCTGNAGGAILTQALGSPQVAHVTTLSRRPPYDIPNDQQSKITSIILPSDEYPRGFDDISPALVDRLKAEGYTSVIWALGISQSQVTKDQYIRITHDYTLSAARAFQHLGTKENPFAFIFISGEGADQTEQSRFLFGKIKGRTEKALAEMSSESFKTVSLRPAVILMTEEHRNRLSTLSRYAWKIFDSSMKTVWPSGTISSTDLGTISVGLATGSRGWDKLTAEGWINNKMMLDLLSNSDDDK